MTLRYSILNMSRNLVQHHVGGYLKIAPEHTDRGHSPRWWNLELVPMTALSKCLSVLVRKRVRQNYLIPYFYCCTSRYNRLWHDESGGLVEEERVSVPIRYRRSIHRRWPPPPPCIIQVKTHCPRWRVTLKMWILLRVRNVAVCIRHSCVTMIQTTGLYCVKP